MRVVRYGRAGKWYLEPSGDLSRLPRQSVSVDEAAKYAAWAIEQGGRIHFGVPFGSTFERRVREALR